MHDHQTNPPPSPTFAELTAFAERGLAQATAEALTATEAPASEPPAAPAPVPVGHGGARENSGRKRLPAKRKKGIAVYVSVTPKQKRHLEREADKAELSVSAYILKKLKLPV